MEIIKKSAEDNYTSLLKELETLDNNIVWCEKLLDNQQSTPNWSKENNESLNLEFNNNGRNTQEPVT